MFVAIRSEAVLKKPLPSNNISIPELARKALQMQCCITGTEKPDIRGD